MKNSMLFVSIIICHISVFARDINKEVKILVSKALVDKKLYNYCENRPKKAKSFHDFRYEFPNNLDPKLYLEFDNILRKYIKENKLYGPNNRPLVIIPILNKVIEEKIPENDNNFRYSNNSNNFGF